MSILCINSSSLRVNLVSQFRKLFRLLTDVSLVPVISLVRAVGNLLRVVPLVILVVVVILAQLDLWVLV